MVDVRPAEDALHLRLGDDESIGVLAHLGLDRHQRMLIPQQEDIQLAPGPMIRWKGWTG